MKKLLVMVLLGVTTMGILTGCGKSEEEKAVGKMQAQIMKEAKKDSEEIEKFMEQHYEAYEKAGEERQKALEEHNAFAEKMQKGVKKPIEAYEAYMDATIAKEVIATAKAYNQAYNEYLKLADGDAEQEKSLVNYLGRQNPHHKRTPIMESVYEVKAAYLEFAGRDQYNEGWIYYSDEVNSAYIVLAGRDEATYLINEMVILKSDGSICKLDLASVMTKTTSMVEPLNFTGDAYLLFTVDNADYKYWQFDATGKTAKGVATDVTEGTYEYGWFDNSLEGLNLEEPK